MIKIFLPALLLSCSSLNKPALPEGTELSSRGFSGPKEARHFVRNKWNFLFLLFEQSYDPYYGTPKWPEECLTKNRLGKIQEKDGHLFFLARLTLNERKEPGHCQGKPTEVIYYHCQDRPQVHEIYCAPGNCETLLSSNLCSLIR